MLPPCTVLSTLQLVVVLVSLTKCVRVCGRACVSVWSYCNMVVKSALFVYIGVFVLWTVTAGSGGRMAKCQSTACLLTMVFSVQTSVTDRVEGSAAGRGLRKVEYRSQHAHVVPLLPYLLPQPHVHPHSQVNVVLERSCLPLQTELTRTKLSVTAESAELNISRVKAAYCRFLIAGLFNFVLNPLASTSIRSLFVP